ncbi:hypothetical protein [Microvirga sp. 17 mud 1-3]|uniref:hypothetical protein n=1 Tax=Microvirga sp. 17 mud 1-3 TaxID=2082949 RepID=UPI000D6D6396|nr:hypothetical protein [Microvirga sp. 17 mud 1-3]AWM86955.1 hypothetical protein C4E04_09590 [Microvirga sp. 17 mud 1-3]
MVIRPLVLAGFLAAPLLAASPALAQSVPLGSLMNAIGGAAQPAPQPVPAQRQPMKGKKASQAPEARPGAIQYQRQAPRRSYPGIRIGAPSDENG